MKRTQVLATLLCTALGACAPTTPLVSETAPAPIEAAKAPQMPQLSEEEMMATWKKASTPAEQHALLKGYVGKWKTESKFWKAPGEAPEVSKGSAKFTQVLGGRFIEQEFNGSMMGHPFNGKGLMGYDNAQEKFVSTWVDSMGTGLMVSSGTIDQDKKAIVFAGDFFCPMMKKNISTREVMSTVSKNQFTFAMFGPAPDGREMKMLEVTYTR